MGYSYTDLEQYLVRHNLVGATADYIRLSSSELARDIGTTGYACVVTEYQSRKMGVTVNTESRTAECSYAIHLDFDPSVEAFYEQPPSVDCSRTTKRGHLRLVNYIPDVLVLSKNGPYVTQVKTERELLLKVSASPDWTQDPDGTFHDLPAERAFAQLGLPHVIVSTSQLDKLRTSNICLLLQSIGYTYGNNSLSNKVRSFFAQHPIATLADVAEEIGEIDITPLLQMIAKHELFTDLTAFSLAEPDACIVSTSPDLLRTEIYEALQHFRRAPQRNANLMISQSELPLSKHLGRAVSIIDQLDSGRRGRTARRWIAKIKTGMLSGQSRIEAATPRYHKSGNRDEKRHGDVLTFAKKFIKAQWTSIDRPSPATIWRNYKTAAEIKHPERKWVSRPTFYRILKENIDSLAYERGGRRAANAAANPTDVNDRAIKPNRPFELAACDHYLCDLNCRVLYANGTAYAIQPWLTIMRDCYTKSVLAFWLSLSAPSRRSCALIIRECLRTHGRLPEWLIVDRGADFRSNYFSGLMSHCGIHLMLRPPGHPRYGSEAERFFGQFKDKWLSSRAGNRVNITEVRSVSGSHRPEQLATLSLLDLWEDLVSFRCWFNNNATDSSLASPAHLEAEGLKRFSCSGRAIPYDDKFIVASAVDDASYKVDPRRGIHIDALHFWNPDLSRCSGKKIPVRRDPQDPYRVYALIEGNWQMCMASSAPAYDAKHPLRRDVEGVIMLGGTTLRNAVREDSDRALIATLEQRKSAPLQPLDPSAVLPWPSTDPANDSEADYFSEIAQKDLETIGTSKW